MGQDLLDSREIGPCFPLNLVDAHSVAQQPPLTSKFNIDKTPPLRLK